MRTNGQAAGERRVFGPGDHFAAGRQDRAEQQCNSREAVVAVGIAGNYPDRREYGERRGGRPRGPMRAANWR
jgi:hypothetical protein